MEREEIINRLSSSFRLAASQIDEKGGRGYRLHLRANWPIHDCCASKFRVQLVGMNPLTGEDVAKDGIIAKLSFDRMVYDSDVLNYHGHFKLCCIAVLGNGEEIVFKEQDINLNYTKNAPFIEYKFSSQNGFSIVSLKSNCWDNCRGKVWLIVDGHDQCIDLPMNSDKQLRFYLPAEGKPEIKVQDDTVILRNGW